MNTARKHAEFADSFTQYDLEFFAHLRSFVKLLARHGVRAEALSPTGITEYKGLGSGARRAIATNFSKYADLLEGAAQSGLDLRREREVLKYVLARVGLKTGPGVMDKIQDGHIIEIYTADHIQIFRNIEFMQYCNYSLLDLLTFTFFDLYERAALVTRKLIDASNRIFCTDVDVLDLQEEFPRHVLRQRFAEPRSEIVLDMKYLWPLHSASQERKGLLSMSQVVGTSLMPDDSSCLEFL